MGNAKGGSERAGAATAVVAAAAAVQAVAVMAAVAALRLRSRLAMAATWLLPSESHGNRVSASRRGAGRGDANTMLQPSGITTRQQHHHPA